MRSRRFAAAVGAVLIGSLAACSPGEDASPSPEPQTAESHSAESSSADVQSTGEHDDEPDEAESGADALGAMTDAEVCTAFNDVLTIVENADIGTREGRMEEQEQQGWYALAARVLDRVPADTGSAVGESIEQLQELAPAVSLGAYPEPTGIRSAEWYDAQEVLSEACMDVGVEMAMSVFTGG